MSLAVEEGLYERVRVLAEVAGYSMSHLVESMIVDHLGRCGYEVALRAAGRTGKGRWTRRGRPKGKKRGVEVEIEV